MMKVIVIDDELIQRKGLVSITPWEQCGCEIAGEAGNAADALKDIRTIMPDIVITDIKMPGMSGLELIHLLRQEIDCEFIVISGYSEFSYAKQALEMGVRHYLLKPVDDEELLEAIRQTVFRIVEKRSIEKLKMESKSGNFDDRMFKNFGKGKIKDKYLEKALNYIADHCNRNLTIKEVADTLHISSSYLWKLFANHMKHTFNEYLTLCRVRRAVEYLKDENLKIYEISEACGYKDTRYFSSVFKKIVGITPTDYREGRNK